jgi:hypothetical protein
VIADPVEDEPQVAAMRLAHESVEDLERSEAPVDVAVIRHVVAELAQRRRVERR